MRILSVVTLVSPDGDYGGPLRVAVNQAAMLHARGHDVVLAGGYWHYDVAPTEIGGVPAALFPARTVVPKTGFAGLFSPGLLRFVASQAKSYDIVHIHVARDLITLPVAGLVRRAGVPYVLQPHGMINASKHPLARLMDPVLTTRVLRQAAKVFYLTPTEREDLAPMLTDPSLLELLTNGVPKTDFVADPLVPEVLYMARLAPRKRPLLMVDIARALRTSHPRYRVRLVGPDEGEAPGLQAAMTKSGADIAWEGALSPDATIERMAQAGIYVLPSVDEPYGMSVLEAMSVGLPVVITNSCGLASLVRDSGAGVVTDPSAEGLIAGIREIIDDPQRAQEMGRAGRQAADDRLGMGMITDTLERVYAGARAGSGSTA